MFQDKVFELLINVFMKIFKDGNRWRKKKVCMLSFVLVVFYLNCMRLQDINKDLSK